MASTSRTSAKARILTASSLSWLAAALLPGGCASLRANPKEPLVDIRDADPRIVVDIRYAAPDNFTHQALYPAARCLLRENVARRLAWVESDLSLQGLGLKVWDCYRPLSIQSKLWEITPDSRFVADPKRGSRHNRGAAVDLTLVDLRSAGGPRELEMPTGFDDFTEKARSDYAGAGADAARNRDLLRRAMERRGFLSLGTEWWHFDAKGWSRYPLLDVPLDGGKILRP